MSHVHYKLSVKGLPSPDGTIPVRALVALLSQLTECAERVLRLAVEGESVRRGKPPAWLQKAVDLTFTGLEAGSTILAVDAPKLGSTIGEQLAQGELWFIQPSPDDTPLSLVSRAIRDAIEENIESGFYVAGVLSGLLNLRWFLKTEAHRVQLFSDSRPQETLDLGAEEMQKIERLRLQTPDPQAVLVSGRLNAIEHSRRQFQLVLSDGQVIPGRVDEAHFDAEELRHFWGRNVTVKGTVHFRPSGKIHLLEAQLVKPMQPGEEILDRLPRGETAGDIPRSVLREPERGDWVADVRGKWPGDETIEDLLEEMKERRVRA